MNFVDDIGEDVSGDRVDLDAFITWVTDIDRIQQHLFPLRILRDPQLSLLQGFLTPLNVDVNKFNSVMLAHINGPLCKYH